MMVSWKYIFLFFLFGILAIILFDGKRTVLLAKKSTVLIKNTTSFRRLLPEAKMNILVLGDSTAYGTGTETSEESTAGRLGVLFPEANIKKSCRKWYEVIRSRLSYFPSRLS